MQPANLSKGISDIFQGVKISITVGYCAALDGNSLGVLIK